MSPDHWSNLTWDTVSAGGYDLFGPIGYLDRKRDRACKQRVIVTPASRGVQLGPRYEGQLNPMAEPIPHEVRPLVRTHVYHPYHAADRQAETDS